MLRKETENIAQLVQNLSLPDQREQAVKELRQVLQAPESWDETEVLFKALKKLNKTIGLNLKNQQETDIEL